jgi:hypothetical protein
MSTMVIIADHDDLDIDRVQKALAESGIAVIRLRLGLLEEQWDVAFDLSHCQLRQGDALLCDESFRRSALAVYRRWKMTPTPPVLSALESDVDREFAEREWGSYLSNVLLYLEHLSGSPPWANRPTANMENKQWMLSVAASMGIAVPATLVGTRLARSTLPPGELVAKALSANEHLNDGRHFPTTHLDAGQVKQLVYSRSPCPSLVQSRVDTAHELRVIVILKQTIALQIQAGGSEADIRLLDPGQLDVEVVDCPPRLAAQLIRLSDALGFNMCVYDILVDHRDRWHLVDVTPNGSWWFYEDCLAEHVVSRKVADALSQTYK